MRTSETASKRSASRLQKGFSMKVMRVMFLAAAVLSGCGPGGEEEGGAGDYATTERAITQGCDELNCQERRTLIAPSDPSVLPQDPVPLHTGRAPQGAAAESELIKPR